MLAGFAPDTSALRLSRKVVITAAESRWTGMARIERIRLEMKKESGQARLAARILGIFRRWVKV